MIIIMDDLLKANEDKIRKRLIKQVNEQVIFVANPIELNEEVQKRKGKIKVIALDMYNMPWKEIARSLLNEGFRVVLWSSLVKERWKQGETERMPENCFGIWDRKDIPRCINAIDKLVRISSGGKYKDKEIVIGKGKSFLLDPAVLFSLLIHRIAHLWLPLDIDLQGIREVLSSKFQVPSSEETKEEWAKEYLEEVLKNKPQDYYRQKLADLQRVVSSKFRVPSSELKEGGEPCSENPKPVNVSEKIKKLMENKESVLDLIEKGKNEKNEEEIEKFKKIKEILLTLAGLKKSESKAQNYEPNPNSAIFKFMCLLDCRIKSKKYDNVEEILKFDWDSLNSELRTLNSELKISDFHSWFQVLIKTFNKISSLFRDGE